MTSNATPTYRIGDMLPRLALLKDDGTPYDLTDQRLAGDSIVLICDARGAAAPRPDPVQRDALDKAGAQLVEVLATPPAKHEGSDFARTLFDPELRLLAMLGMKAPGLVLVDPAFRLAYAAENGSFDGVLESIGAFCDGAPAVITSRIAPVLVIPNVLEPDLVRRTMRYWAEGSKIEGGVASNAARKPNAVAKDFKRRTDVVISDADLFTTLRQRLERRVIPAAAKAFAFQIANMEALRIGRYSATDHGFFRRHRDNATRYTAHRKFAMTLNLNRGEYEGGGLLFPEFGETVYQAPTGGAILFSCSLLHEALPVTKGDRFAMFTFFTDGEGVKRQASLAAELKNDPRAAVTMRH